MEENHPRRRRRYSAEEKSEILAAYERRTTTQRLFCMERGISMATLQVWRRRQQGLLERASDFVELPAAGVGGSDYAVHLELAGGLSLRIAAGTDVRWLRDLLLVLPCGA